MARIGIGYEQVSKAASDLANEGHAVTVDNVRQRLGGTGSKSTIAPLLKRWKTANAGEIGTQPALPIDLLRSVQRLYDEVARRFETDLATSNIESALRLDEFRAENGRLNQRLVESQEAGGKLQGLFADTKDRLAARDAELAAARTELSESKLSHAFLEQRVQERAAEISSLRSQVTQAHQQFEHYQTASQRRWDQERTLHETKLADALRANEQIRQELRHAEHQSVTSHARIEQLASTHENLALEYKQLQAACDQLRQENVRLTEANRTSALETRRCGNTLTALRDDYDLTVTKLSENETRLAVSLSNVAMLEASVAACENRAASLMSAHLAHLREFSDLESELRNCKRELGHPHKP
jgi:chromosome segregation ATPase